MWWCQFIDWLKFETRPTEFPAQFRKRLLRKLDWLAKEATIAWYQCSELIFPGKILIKFSTVSREISAETKQHSNQCACAIIWFNISRVFMLLHPSPLGRFPYKKEWLFVVPFIKVILVPLMMFSLKRSTAGAFAEPFRILSRKQYDSRYLTINFTSKRYLKQSPLALLKIMKVSVNVVFSNWYLFGVKIFSSPARSQNRISVSLMDSFQNFRQALPSFL